MQLHNLQPQTKQQKKKRVGRGGKRGKTSGRGHKGQKSRAGGSPRPEIRDRIKKIPKLRGHGKNRPRTVVGSKIEMSVVNLGAIDKKFTADEIVNPKTLVEKGLVPNKGGRIPDVKILSQGTFTTKCAFENCSFSKTARDKATKAGATIQ